MARKASMATQTAIIMTNEGLSPHSMKTETGRRNAATAMTKSVEVTASEMSEVV